MPIGARQRTQPLSGQGLSYSERSLQALGRFSGLRGVFLSDVGRFLGGCGGARGLARSLVLPALVNCPTLYWRCGPTSPLRSVPGTTFRRGQVWKPVLKQISP